MISEKLKKRLQEEREMVAVSIQIPIDLVEELEDVAEKLDFSNYQSLIRFYIGQGLRKDIKKIYEEG